MNSIKILIIEDHLLLTESWCLYFSYVPEIEVLGCGNSGEAAVELAGKYLPDIILMDINLPGMSGLDATEKIVQQYPSIKILAISMHKEPGYVRSMMQKGASGYLSKESSPGELIKAIYDVYEGKKYLSDSIKNTLCEQLVSTPQNQGLESLSARELEISNLLKDGSSSKEIAEQLGLSYRTVEAHRHNILKKLNIKNTAHLVNLLNTI